MAELISARAFEEAEGVEDWRVLGRGACTVLPTGSFPVGVELVEAIGALAEAADHHPDVDLRPATVTVRFPTRHTGAEPGRPGPGPADLRRRPRARRPRRSERRRGCRPHDRRAVRRRVIRFWRAVLGSYDQVGEQDLLDPGRRSAAIWFQPMSGRGRNATASTSTSRSPPTRPRRASPRRSPAGDM